MRVAAFSWITIALACGGSGSKDGSSTGAEGTGTTSTESDTSGEDVDTSSGTPTETEAEGESTDGSGDLTDGSGESTEESETGALPEPYLPCLDLRCDVGECITFADDSGSVCHPFCNAVEPDCPPVEGFIVECKTDDGHCVIDCSSDEDCPDGMFCSGNCFWSG